ncbi:hypothetical protein [Chlorobium sp. N1]|uniref:hypothetical protein n=1 Tax=Chlorobium sp. N1 TaxID=2491138 RepID=UPI00103872EA|nr:hypothetical protein [Chlorobium sp. N1]TCD46818.1 hypothetical protein E0L29_11325 [Chlorobium sp. N1]
MNAFDIAPFSPLASAWVMVIAQLVRILIDDPRDSLEMMLAIIGVSMYYFSGLGLIYIAGVDNVVGIVFSFIVIADILRAIFAGSQVIPLQRTITYSSIREYGVDRFVFFFLLLWASFSGLFIGYGGGKFLSLFLFTVPYAVSLIFFERILSYGVGRKVVVWLLALYVFMTVVYLAFYWSGFGRMIILGYVLVPILLASHYMDVKFRAWFVVLISPVASFVSHFSRYGSVSDVSDLTLGSAAHHIAVTSDAFQYYYSGLMYTSDSFLDQYLLFLFNWVPRDMWPDKPIGAGWSSVGEMYGRAGYGEGYSQSLGFIGEQVYLLGPWFLVGLFVMIATLIVLRFFLIHASKGYVLPVILFDVSLMAYFWGGMASVGSRLWFALIPVLFYIQIVDRISVRRQGLYASDSFLLGDLRTNGTTQEKIRDDSGYERQG